MTHHSHSVTYSSMNERPRETFRDVDHIIQKKRNSNDLSIVSFRILSPKTIGKLNTIKVKSISRSSHGKKSNYLTNWDQAHGPQDP